MRVLCTFKIEVKKYYSSSSAQNIIIEIKNLNKIYSIIGSNMIAKNNIPNICYVNVNYIHKKTISMGKKTSWKS